MRHRRIALALAILALALLAASGLGVRAGLWPFRFGFGLFAGSLIAGLAAAGVAAVALLIPRLRAGSMWLALILGLATAAVPLEHVRRVKALPYINDITTDTDDPPQFAPPKPYERHFAELQKIGYPQLAPLDLPLAPARAFAHALDAARAMGWEIVAADESAGRIQASSTTLWFGFTDDVVVRIAPRGAGSRVDVRSKSRVGRSDLGANAKRIQEFLTLVARGASYRHAEPGRAHRVLPRPRGGAALAGRRFADLAKKAYSSGIVSGRQDMSMKQIVFSVIAAVAVSAWAQAPAKPEAAKEPAKKEEAAPQKQAAAAGPKIPKPRRWNEDARHCLERSSNTEIIKCAEEFL